MKLFEAEELKKAFVNKGQHSRRYHVGDFWELNFKEICEVLNDAPTVEAIPIEWMKKFANERALNDGMDCYWHFWGEDLLQMIELWEEENGQKEQ